MKVKMYVVVEAVSYCKYGNTEVFVDNDEAYLSFDEATKSLINLISARYEQTKIEFAHRTDIKTNNFLLHVNKACLSCHGKYVVVSSEDESAHEIHTFGIHQIDTLSEVEG